MCTLPKQLCFWVLYYVVLDRAQQASIFASSPGCLGASDVAGACACSVAQSCLTLGNTVDCGPPGSSVHGIFQPRILEWVAMPSSRGSSRPRDRTSISYVSCIAGRFFTPEPPGKPPFSLNLNSILLHACSILLTQSSLMDSWVASTFLLL